MRFCLTDVTDAGVEALEALEFLDSPVNAPLHSKSTFSVCVVCACVCAHGTIELTLVGYVGQVSF